MLEFQRDISPPSYTPPRLKGPPFTIEDRGHGRMPVSWGKEGKP